MHDPANNEFVSLGLVVAKCTIRQSDPTILDVVYYSDTQTGDDDHGPRKITLSSSSQNFRFIGQYTATCKTLGEVPEEVSDEVVVDFTARGEKGCDLVIYNKGKVIVRGLGLVDPDDDYSLLISGWTREIEPYGIVKYTIRDTSTITGYYLSKMTPEEPGRDMVSGDTSRGFPGKYVLHSEEVNGRTWGPHQWQLVARGELIDLIWSENGKVFCRGFGIYDPEDVSSIIVNYIPVER